jgi:hypothetical protein
VSPRPFNRWLVAPFLAVFFFPIMASIGTGLFQCRIDWNNNLLGLPGSSAAAPLPWSVRAWWTGDFQKSFASWWENRCPNRSFLLRLFNQVDYSCLRSSYMLQGGIVVGPDGQLDLKDYLLDACHQTPLPPDHIARMMDKLERLRAQLQRQGKSLLILTTPTKAATYPATIPARFRAYAISYPRAYDELVQALSRSDIPFVDGAGIVHAEAGSAPYPLFLQGGLHWDSYATAQVLPGLAEKVARLTGQPLAVPAITGVRLVKAKHALNQADHDLASLLNLLSRPFSYLSPQLDLAYPPQPAAPGASIVLAGGSFTWNLLALLGGAGREGGANVPFAYYGTSFYDSALSLPITRLAYERALAASDLLVLELNEQMPETTLDALPSVIDESAGLSASPDWEISFAQGGNSADFTSAGFSRPEAESRWTDGDDAVLVVPLPAGKRLYTLTAQVKPFLSGAHRRQRIEILADDKRCGGTELASDGPATLTATFPASTLVRICFHFLDAASPSQLQAGDDPRRLALAFFSVQIHPTDRDLQAARRR